MAPRTADPTLRVMALPDTALQSPFPELDVELSGISLRETAYEVLIAASGITAMSARTRHQRSKSGITSTASKLKKAILLRPKTSSSSGEKGKDQQPQQLLLTSSSASSAVLRAGKKPTTTAEVVRYQMEISEQTDDRIRKGLIKAAGAQVNKPIEAMLIPLELLLNTAPSQFADQSEYQQWRLRQLRVLEAGLVLHPAYEQEGEDELSDRLQQMLLDLAQNSVETGSKNEAWLSLRIAAMAKAGRTQNGESPRSVIHWADGFPMNVHLYDCLLSYCFDTLDEAVLVDEFDEILEWIKKTWGILGINPMLHSLCFMWVLFSQFVKTGETEPELLVAAEEQMKEAAEEAKSTLNPDYVNSFRAAVSTILSWTEPRLLAYREAFPHGADGIMAALLSLTLTAARINAEELKKISPRKRNKGLATLEADKVDTYIRSSMRAAFTQIKKNLDTKSRSVKGDKPRPPLAVLAEEVGLLAEDERGKFCPVQKKWHLTPAGVAAAELHSCFGKELKQYVAGLKGISPDGVVALQAADELEADLVQIAVEDGGDAEDGGKSLIREMPPYEAQSVMETLSQKWVEDCVGRLTEWVDRNVQNEQWNPKATREGYAPSSVEVLRIIEETLDAFFFLPISQDPVYVKRVVGGVTQGVHRYCEKTLAGCGKKEAYVPSLPPLTRFNRKDNPQKGGWRSLFRSNSKTKRSSSFRSPSARSSELGSLCVRINTLDHISSELQYLDKRLSHGWAREQKAGGGAPDHVGAAMKGSFKGVRDELEQGVQYLIELASYRVIFHDLKGVFWDGLYVGGVENARIPQVLELVDPQLGVIAEVAAEQLRNRIVAALMKACLDCLILVLLAGGPSRVFVVEDADLLDEDLGNLKDLFKADGEGLPDHLVDDAAVQVQEVLVLFHKPTDELIRTLRASYPEIDGIAGASRYSKAAPVPKTTGAWSPKDPNTILRVLCYRADDPASQWLKKTFKLPKKLS